MGEFDGTCNEMATLWIEAYCEADTFDEFEMMWQYICLRSRDEKA